MECIACRKMYLLKQPRRRHDFPFIVSLVGLIPIRHYKGLNHMLKKLTALAFSGGLCLMAGIQTAAAGVSLFKGYTYGTPIDTHARSLG